MPPRFQPLLSKLDITLFANTRSASYSIQGAKGLPFESKMLSEKLSISNIPQVTRRGRHLVTQDRQTLSIWFPTNVPLREADLKLDEKNNSKGLPDIAILFDQRKMRLLSKKLAKKNNSGVVPDAYPVRPTATLADAAIVARDNRTRTAAAAATASAEAGTARAATMAAQATWQRRRAAAGRGHAGPAAAAAAAATAAYQTARAAETAAEARETTTAAAAETAATTAAETAAAVTAESTADTEAVTTFNVKVKKIIDITHKNIEVILRKLFKNPIDITISNKKYIIREYKWLKSLYPPYGYKIRGAIGNIWPGTQFVSYNPGTVVTFNGRPGRTMNPSHATLDTHPDIVAAFNPAIPLLNSHRNGIIVDTAAAAGTAAPLPPGPNQVWVKVTNNPNNRTGIVTKGTIWEVPTENLRIVDHYPRYKPKDDPNYDDDDDDDDDDAEEDIRTIPQREWGTPGNSEKWWKQRVVDWAYENTTVGGRSGAGACNRFWKIIPQPLAPGGHPPEPITNEIERGSNRCSMSLYPSTENGLMFQIICELTLIPDNGYHAAISKRNKETKRNKALGKKTAKKHFGENCRDSAAEIKEIKRGRKISANKNKMVGGTRRRGTRRRGTRSRGTRR